VKNVSHRIHISQYRETCSDTIHFVMVSTVYNKHYICGKFQHVYDASFQKKWRHSTSWIRKCFKIQYQHFAERSVTSM